MKYVTHMSFLFLCYGRILVSSVVFSDVIRGMSVTQSVRVGHIARPGMQ